MNHYLTAAILALVLLAVAAEAERQRDLRQIEALGSWPPWGPIPAGKGPSTTPKPAPTPSKIPPGTLYPVLHHKPKADEMR